jgi:DNA-binding NtrC family response regulator
MPGTVLVVDDKEMLRDSVGATLARAGLEVQVADSAQAALLEVARKRPDCVVTDLKMPGMSGMELLEQLKKIDDELPVVLMTAFGTVETAVKALKVGAFDYITKPFEGDELIIAVKRAIEHGRVLRENAILRYAGESGGVAGGEAHSKRNGSATAIGLSRLIGASPAMRRVKEQVLAVAESQGTVLICGESGTGKEVVARAIHECSPRKSLPLLGVNCAALSESLLESELFGHERGAFTGADKLRKGRFELADGGTLLLDEISEVPTRIQAKLLRVLQERCFERVGASISIGVDVRVIATSNQDLPKAIAKGEFRQDLFFRLNVLPIHLPPLRDRLEDVPALAEHFLLEVSRRDGRGPMRFDEGAVAALKHYAWPGNVRELFNIVERAVVLSKAEVITRDVLEPWLTTQATRHQPGVVVVNGVRPANHPAGVEHAHGHANGLNGHHEVHEPKPDSESVTIAGRVLEDIERDAIVLTLQKLGGHRQKTAQALGIGVRTLGLKLKKWKEMRLVDAAL